MQIKHHSSCETWSSHNGTARLPVKHNVPSQQWSTRGSPAHWSHRSCRSQQLIHTDNCARFEKSTSNHPTASCFNIWWCAFCLCVLKLFFCTDSELDLSVTTPLIYRYSLDMQSIIKIHNCYRWTRFCIADLQTYLVDRHVRYCLGNTPYTVVYRCHHINKYTGLYTLFEQSLFIKKNYVRVN